MAESTPKPSYYQFHPEANYPIYAQCLSEDVDPQFPTYMKEMGFTPLTAEQEKNMAIFLARPHARMLKIKGASPRVATKIGIKTEEDHYGSESVTPGNGHQFYRFQGQAIMIYSFQSVEWELGVLPHFGRPSQKESFKTIFARYLALALSPHGVVGHFALPYEGGLLLTKPLESKGLYVFIDPARHLLLWPTRVEKMKGPLLVYRMDPFLREEKIKMKKEEFLSFLLSRTLYFDFGGIPITVRRAYLAISQMAQGLKCSERTFRQGTGLTF